MHKKYPEPIVIFMSLNLDKIAATLSGLEEEIIYKMINRIQFRHNPAIYQSEQSGFTPKEEYSLFDLRLRYQEDMDSQFGRFSVPEERPYFKDLSPARRPVPPVDSELHLVDIDGVNLSEEVRAAYLKLVPVICPEGEDGHYGSSVEHDIMLYQVIMRRIHYGALYIAESKYQQNPDQYQSLIEKKDAEGLLKLLTREEVEIKIYQRIKHKVEEIQKDVNTSLRILLDPQICADFYKNTIIPLTKKGEIRYLLQRFNNEVYL